MGNKRVMAAAAAAAVALLLAAAPGWSRPIRLSDEGGTQLGVLCRYFDPEREPAPPEAQILCDAAVALAGRKAAASGKTVQYLGLQGADGEEDREVPLPAVDGPVLLLVLEGRPDWSGQGRPRLLLQAREVRGGEAAPSVGVPPVPVLLGGEGWRAAADRAVEQVVGFALRDG